MKKFIKIFALCLTLALMLSVSALATGTGLSVTSSVPTELELLDAETKPLKITGTYDANALVSLEVKENADGTVVLSQQAVCDETGAFELKGIMSDEVDVGEYTIYIGATGLDTASEYILEVLPDTSIITFSNSGNENCTITVYENDAEEGALKYGPVTYNVGTKLRLEASCGEDYEFLYWKDPNHGDAGKIVSENNVMETYVGTDAEYQAVFAYLADPNIYVTFKANNQILLGPVFSSQVGEADIPNPYIAGYKFYQWYVNGDKNNGAGKTPDLTSLTETTTYVAGFSVDETPYTVTVDGVALEAYKYNEKATVTAAVKEGLVFTYWTCNDEIVSYDETYSFFVNGDTDLVPHYGTEEVEKGIVLVMAQPIILGDVYKISFYAERNLPEQYTLIETGIVMYNTKDLEDKDDFYLGTDGALSRAAESTSKSGKFTLRKADVSEDDEWSAKAYLIYMDENQNKFTLYSNRVTGTFTTGTEN